MSIDDFAAITQRVIARDGFDEFLPTAVFPQRNQLAALQGVPAGVDIEAAAMKWARGKARPDEEYLVAFKLDPTHFKVVRCHGDQIDHGVFEVA